MTQTEKRNFLHYMNNWWLVQAAPDGAICAFNLHSENIDDTDFMGTFISLKSEPRRCFWTFVCNDLDPNHLRRNGKSFSTLRKMFCLASVGTSLLAFIHVMFSFVERNK